MNAKERIGWEINLRFYRHSNPSLSGAGKIAALSINKARLKPSLYLRRFASICG
jgi:hypothetical protein